MRRLHWRAASGARLCSQSRNLAQSRFATAISAVVQKLATDEHNLVAMDQNYTESWPAIADQPDLIVLLR